MRMQREGKHSSLRTKGLEEIVSPLVAIKLRVSPTAVCYDALYISCTDRLVLLSFRGRVMCWPGGSNEPPDVEIFYFFYI